MIPMLQFDPATLTFWYDTHLISRARGSESIGIAMDLALRGSDQALASHIHAIDDPWVKTRSANVASAVWHEKRHFLDFVLTNYGAFRVRQFFMIYSNIPTVIRSAWDAGRLLLPVQTYLNPIMCKRLSVDSPPPEMLIFAQDVLARKKMMEDDRQPEQSRFGRLEVGGEALLEAIAYFVQISKTHRTLGQDLSFSIQQDSPDRTLIAGRYSWAFHILASAGLLEFKPSNKAYNGEHTLMELNDPPFLPLCYAALASRLWGQDQKNNADTSSYLPKYRLATLGIHLRSYASQLQHLSSVDCWDLINRVSKEIFGRDVITEMQTDFSYEEQLIKKFRENTTFPSIIEAYEDYHELRGMLLKTLIEDPALIIDQGTWCDKFVKRLQPTLIVAASGGEVGEPPESHDLVFGYSDPHISHSDVPGAKWWWAVSPNFWPDPEAKDAICLKNRKAWLSIVSELAPAAKLLLDGRRPRTMLGPELVHGENRLSSQFKVNLQFDPRFAYPKHEVDINYWKYATGQDTFRCDLTYEAIHWPEGHVIDPWAIRLKKGLVEDLLGDFNGNYVKYLELWRDWSPWIVSDKLSHIVQRYDDDLKPFTSFRPS